MDTVRRTMVVGVFDSPDSARNAVQALKDSGFDAADIDMSVKDQQHALVTVRADRRYGEAHEILGRHGAHDIENRYAGTSSTVGPGTAPNPSQDERPSGYEDYNRDYDRVPDTGYGSGFTTEGPSDTGLTTTSPRGAGPWEEGNDYEVTGGEDYPPHEHRFVGDRCEVCGATRRYRKAA